MYKISVIIPTFNRLDILKQTLQSYNNQSLNSSYFEMIIINDGSSDGTYQFLQSCSDLFKYNITTIHQENSGPNAARERGVKIAKGDILLITGDDMVPSANFLQEHLLSHSKYHLDNYAVLGFIDWHKDIKVDNFMRYITKEGGEQFGFDFIKDGEFVNYPLFYTSNISLKRNFIKDLDYIFDKDFTYPAYDDIELGFRLSLKGMKIFYNKKAVVYHHHSINIKSFCNREYNAGKMAWVFINKQPAEILGKKTFLKTVNEYDSYSNKDFQNRLTLAAKELNRVDFNLFKGIVSQGKEISSELQNMATSVFQNMIFTHFAQGIYDALDSINCYKKRLKIAILPENFKETASFCIRLLYPSALLKILSNIGVLYSNQINNSNVKDIDVVLLQRSSIFHKSVQELIKIVKDNGKKVFLDIDDILWESDSDEYSNFKQLNNFTHLLDGIIVPTDELKKETEKTFDLPVKKFENYVDISFFYPNIVRRSKKSFKILIGGTHSHIEDFNFLIPVIKEIQNKYRKVYFYFWGYLPDALKEHRGIFSIPFENKYIDYSMKLIKSDFDLALVPLIDNKFNRVKSSIKWLEYSMCKIPTIFSDTIPYQNIENLKTGIKVVNIQKDWVDAISLLIEDDQLRDEISENAYRNVLSNHTLQKNFYKILEFFQ